MKRIGWLTVTVVSLAVCEAAVGLSPVVEAEETVYTYTDAKNGAGPLWCHGPSGAAAYLLAA